MGKLGMKLPEFEHKDLKLYICVKEEVPAHMVPVLVGHAVLRAEDDFKGKLDYELWRAASFKKCVVKMNEKEFSKVLEVENISESWENSTLGGSISCVVVCPRVEYPNVIKFAKLWTP